MLSGLKNLNRYKSSPNTFNFYHKVVAEAVE